MGRVTVKTQIQLAFYLYNFVELAVNQHIYLHRVLKVQRLSEQSRLSLLFLKRVMPCF
jgi:hypothetical protein